MNTWDELGCRVCTSYQIIKCEWLETCPPFGMAEHTESRHSSSHKFNEEENSILHCGKRWAHTLLKQLGAHTHPELILRTSLKPFFIFCDF